MESGLGPRSRSERLGFARHKLEGASDLLRAGRFSGGDGIARNRWTLLGSRFVAGGGPTALKEFRRKPAESPSGRNDTPSTDGLSRHWTHEQGLETSPLHLHRIINERATFDRAQLGIPASGLCLKQQSWRCPQFSC